jgi:transcriptional regulator with XRE-family HTH domain
MRVMKNATRRLTRLGTFIAENKLKPNELADVTGISRQHVARLRFGLSEPTRPVMIWITIACRRLLGNRRRVRLTELFDLGDGE